MKKIFKIFVLLTLFFLLLLNSVSAFSINMNLENTAQTDTTNIVKENSTQNNLSENETLNNNTDDTETDNSSSKITTNKTTKEDEFLTIENILSIIIIVIGILLIFLSIAILIRFK